MFRRYPLPHRRGITWPRRTLLLGVAAFALAAAVLPFAVAQPPAPAPAANPLDQPLAWLNEARKYNQGIRDYSCTLIKQERIKGALQAENIVQMKFRAQPFSVNMRWLAPKDFQNQEVSYIHGKNRNQMRVRSTGLLKVAGFVSIDPNDPRVMQHSRHTIYEAGIGTLIEKTAKAWESEKAINKTQVRVSEYDYNRRRVFRIETIHPERHPQFYSYRNVLYLDKDTKLPMRAENYEWPRPGASADGELMEVFSFVDLNVNIGLTDNDFNR